MDKHERGQVVTSAAEVYEEFFVPALFADWPAHVLNAGEVEFGQTVLDVACGTGVLAREAAQRVGPHGSVVGVDINGGMLAVAKQKSPQNITWKVAPAGSLPFESASFDRVVSQFGLMFFEDQIEAIREMHRVLRPGGKMAVAVWGPLSDTPGYAVVVEILAELFGSEVAKSIEAPYALGDPQQLASLFARAGMENTEIQTLPGQARFASIESWIYTDIKGWTLANVIDDEGYEMLTQVAPERLSQFQQPDGSVVFDAPAHIITVATAL